jgi:hypothetical protein
MTNPQHHLYQIRPRKDHRGVNLISDALPFGALWYSEPDAISNAIGYAKFFSRSHDAVIRVYDEAGNVIAMHGACDRFHLNNPTCQRPSGSSGQLCLSFGYVDDDVSGRLWRLSLVRCQRL